MDWCLPNVPWNHQHTSRGAPQSGAWRISAAEKGTYLFEVRRWPREVDAPISGIPSLDKTVDAWDARGGRPYLIYAGENSRFKALPVASIRLKVGDFENVQKVNSGDTNITVNVPLEQADYEVVRLRGITNTPELSPIRLQRIRGHPQRIHSDRSA